MRDAGEKSVRGADHYINYSMNRRASNAPSCVKRHLVYGSYQKSKMLMVLSKELVFLSSLAAIINLNFVE